MDLYHIVQVSSPVENTPSLHDRLRGFAAGVASGISKLAIGHPFGKQLRYIIDHIHQY
jgi:hypothetical protein